MTTDEAARNRILGQFVLSAYRGEFNELDRPLRWATIQRRIEESGAAHSLDAENDLSQLVLRQFGTNVLRSIDLNPFDGPFINWPANLGHGGHLGSDPIANLILMSALFDSPSEFSAAAMKIPHSRTQISAGGRPLTRKKRSLPKSLSEAKEKLLQVQEQMGPARNNYLFLRAVGPEFSMISLIDPGWIEEHLFG